MIRFKVPQKFEGINNEGLTNDEAIQKSVRGYIVSCHYKSPEWLPNEDEEAREERWMWERVSKGNSRFALSHLYFSYLDDLVPPDLARILKQEILAGVGGEKELDQVAKTDASVNPKEDNQINTAYTLFKYAEYDGDDERVMKLFRLLKSSTRRQPAHYQDGDFGILNNPLTIFEQRMIAKFVVESLETFKNSFPECEKMWINDSALKNEAVIFLGESLCLAESIAKRLYEEDFGDAHHDIARIAVDEIFLIFKTIFQDKGDMQKFIASFDRYFRGCRDIAFFAVNHKNDC